MTTLHGRELPSLCMLLLLTTIFFYGAPTPSYGQGETSQDEEVLEVETNLVNLLFTAVDKNKRFLTDIRREDISVLEDGKPQELSIFERQTDLPLALAILVDTSASQEVTLPAEKIAATRFIESVVRPEKDEVAIISFAGTAVLEQEMTNDLTRARAAINSIKIVLPPNEEEGIPVAVDPTQPPIGSTAIWDAILATCDDLIPQLVQRGRPQLRRAIILLTDGINTSGRTKMKEAIETAVKTDTIIYALGVGNYAEDGVDKGALSKVAERTGGRAYFPVNETELRAAFGQIAQELRSQYIAAYSPTNKRRDGKFRQVRIEVVNRELKKQKLRLTYRKGYFAPTASSAFSPSIKHD